MRYFENYLNNIKTTSPTRRSKDELIKKLAHTQTAYNCETTITKVGWLYHLLSRP